MNNTINQIRFLDDCSNMNTPIHKIHPFSKIFVTILNVVIIVSFGKYDLQRMLPFILYPVVIMSFSDIKAKPILKRSLLALPFTLGIGIFNLFYDTNIAFNIYGISITYGLISFINILVKTMLSVFSVLLLMATTGMDKITKALILLKFPKIFVLQIHLTYRYIIVLVEEVTTIINAYKLRTINEKGVKINIIGSLVGQALLRSYFKAQRIYYAMELRGFNGDFKIGDFNKLNRVDLFYILGWTIFFIFARIFNIPRFFDLLLSGVIR